MTKALLMFSIFYAVRKSPIIQNLLPGCGLDKRYERVGIPQSQFIDIDLANVMSVKESISDSNPNYLQIGQSVFEMDWMAKVLSEHMLFLAEGVFMYCNETDLRSYVTKCILIAQCTYLVVLP